MRVPCITGLSVVTAAVLGIGTASAVVIDMVTVRNAGNAADPSTGSLYGSVNYEYQIGKYEITIGQYAAFLNAIAKTDSNGLYNPSMGTDLRVAGIARSGDAGWYSYGVIGPAGLLYGQSTPNRPITHVSWANAARFANWMANGQPTGGQDSSTTEDGTYTLIGITASDAPVANAVNPNTGRAPTYRIPTRDEWYKAAYYDPTRGAAGAYWRFATQSDAAPGNIVGDSANQANYFTFYTGAGFSLTQAKDALADQNYLSDVGSFSSSVSFYGTFDQTGNAYEWTDALVTPSGGVSINGVPTLTGSVYREIRGGSWITNDRNGSTRVSSSSAGAMDQLTSDDMTGFRLASPVAVPEPSTWAMGIGGLAYGLWGMSRRRKTASHPLTWTGRRESSRCDYRASCKEKHDARQSEVPKRGVTNRSS